MINERLDLILENLTVLKSISEKMVRVANRQDYEHLDKLIKENDVLIERILMQALTLSSLMNR